MKIRTGLVEEQQKSQLANENTIGVKRRFADLDRKMIGQVLGEVSDTVDLGASQQLSQLEDQRSARIEELKKLYASGNLKYDSRMVAGFFAQQVDEEISFDKILSKPEEREEE